MTSPSWVLSWLDVKNRSIEWAQDQLESFQVELAGLTEAASGETKSTAGDKHETALAMVQQEQDQLRRRQAEWNKHLMMLKALKDPLTDQIQVGSLFQSEKGFFFIATALGKLTINGIDVHIISPTAPVAQLAMGMKAGEKKPWQNSTFTILHLIS